MQLILFGFLALFGLTYQQVLLKPPTEEDPVPVFALREDPNDNDCLAQMREVLTPQNLTELWGMVSSSGRWLNQLGDFQYCSHHMNEFEFITLSAKINGIGLAFIRLGICVPRHCANSYSLGDISKRLGKFIMDNFDLGGDVIEVQVQQPNQLNAETLPAGAWGVIAIILLACLLGIIGIVVQYTKFGDIPTDPSIDPDELLIEEKKSKLSLFFYSFNPIANLQKLFTVEPAGDQTLTVINGVKAFNLGWLIVGTTFTLIQFMPVLNIETMHTLYDHHLFALFPSGLFSADVFFSLSGFLNCCLITERAYPKKGLLNWPLVFFQLYYKLIFTVMFVSYFAVYLIQYLGNGPFYRRGFEALIDTCKDNWWPNFIFINNFYPWKMSEECIGWLWWLANDTQFFLLGIPVIIVYCCNRIAGYIFAFLFVAGCMAVNGALTYTFDLSIFWLFNAPDFDMQDYMYSKPWSRMGSYFIGAIFGFGYFELACQEKHPELKNSLFNKIYKLLKWSRIASLACFVVGVALTAYYVFPLRHFFID